MFVLSIIQAGSRDKLPDDETIAEYQRQLFGDFNEESFSQPSKHDGFEERRGPKDECIVVIANPPIGETWASIEERSAEVLAESITTMSSSQRIPKCIKWRLRSVRKLRQWLISGKWTSERDRESTVETAEKESCSSNTSDASRSDVKITS